MPRRVGQPEFLRKLRERAAKAKPIAPSAEALAQAEAAAKDPDKALDRAEALLEAANDATAVARNLYITFILFALYLAISVGGVTDEMLLRDTGIAIPLLDKVELPVHTFFAVAPWLFVLLHFETLLHFALLARKTFRFQAVIADLHRTRPNEIASLRERVANFPFLHWLVRGNGDRLLSSLAGLALWITLLVGPAILLLFAQLTFLPYHSAGITWGHRIALIADIALVAMFLPRFVDNTVSRRLSRTALIAIPVELVRGLVRIARHRDRANLKGAGRSLSAAWKDRRYGDSRFLFLALPLIPFSVLVATLPDPEEGLEPLLTGWMSSRTIVRGLGSVDDFGDDETSPTDKAGATCVFPFGLRVRVVAGVSRDSGMRNAARGTAKRDGSVHAWLPHGLPALCDTILLFHSDWSVTRSFHRTLSLREKTLVANASVSADTWKALDAHFKSTTAVAESHVEALRPIDGLDLRDRDLRYADFGRSRLIKADLRYEGTRLDGADLSETTLWGVDMTETRVQGVSLGMAQLQGASLDWAQLQGASLDWAQLQGGSLDGAQLQGASFYTAQLQGASLDGAQLQGARFQRAQLQGASLGQAGLQGANLNGAQLQGASLDGAQLQGANLGSAELQGASLDGAQLQGANMGWAELQGANLDEAGLQGANLNGAQLQGASLARAQLQGASLARARLQLNSVGDIAVGPLGADKAGEIVTGLAAIPVVNDKMKQRMTEAASRVRAVTGKPAAPWQPEQCHPAGPSCRDPLEAGPFAIYRMKQWAEIGCDWQVLRFRPGYFSAVRQSLVRAFLNRLEPGSIERHLFAQTFLAIPEKGCPNRAALPADLLKELQEAAKVPPVEKASGERKPAATER
jgi:uncharacterized protein YjbI with pentapeptide repeats